MPQGQLVPDPGPLARVDGHQASPAPAWSARAIATPPRPAGPTSPRGVTRSASRTPSTRPPPAAARCAWSPLGTRAARRAMACARSCPIETTTSWPTSSWRRRSSRTQRTGTTDQDRSQSARSLHPGRVTGDGDVQETDRRGGPLGRDTGMKRIDCLSCTAVRMGAVTASSGLGWRCFAVPWFPRDDRCGGGVQVGFLRFLHPG
jgi:hypothetical protein